MKQFYFFAAVFLCAGGIFSANAQDLIILRDGSVIEAKVTEISPSEIRYKRYNYLDGPTIVIPVTNVLSIRYENGNVEQFGDTVPIAKSDKPKSDKPKIYAMNPDKLNFGISINPAGFIPSVGRGLAVTADFTKRRFNSLIDIRSGFGLPIYSSEYFGMSASFSYFHPGRIGGFYIGPLLEYSAAEGYETVEKYDTRYDSYGTPHKTNYRYEKESVTVHSFGVALAIGYKFVTQSGMYFRTGANLGYSFGQYDFIIRPDLTFGYNFQGSRRAPDTPKPSGEQ